MSLRDEYIKLYGPEPVWDQTQSDTMNGRDPSNWRMGLRFWAEATNNERERALRIVREEVQRYMRVDSPIDLAEDIESRLKGDDNG